MADEPSLGEIGRGVADLKNDLRALRGELVRADVYQANRATDEIRIKAVEAELVQMKSDRAAMRRLVYTALLAAAGSTAVQVITALVSQQT